ncbi:MAG: TldD/PmbA family protein, partial [Actinobacteria bacterium]|nr:TldD/PmbA family protein [Actinomycetota bacterium]
MDNSIKNGKENDLISECKNAALKISKKSLDEYEIYGFSASHNEIELYKGDVENLSFSDTKGIGFRIFKNKKMGYSYTSNFDENAIDDCIARAVENAEISDADEFNYLPDPSEFVISSSTVDRDLLYSKDFGSFSTEDKIAITKELEKISLKKDCRVSGINNLTYSDMSSLTLIMNSRGLFDHYRTTSAFTYLSVISKGGTEEISTGDYFGYARDLSGFNIENIAENAVMRSVTLLGARKIKSVTADLLIDPFVGAQFLQFISDTVSADAVQKGKSLFKDKLNKPVFSISLNIFDDGTLKNGLSSKPFDGEGVPKGRTAVFENGNLATFLYNSYTARKDGRSSTGNAVRASYKSPPQTGVSNFYIE